MELNPNDPALTADDAPHETSGTLRMHRNGVPSREIMSMLRLKGTQLIGALTEAQRLEREAALSGRPIHASLITRED